MNTIITIFQKCGPVYALMSAILCVSIGLPRRPDFKKRALLSCGIFIFLSSVSLLFNDMTPFHIYLRTLYHFLMFFAIALLIWLSFDAPLLQILYISTLGIILQYFLYSVSEVIQITLAFSGHPVSQSSVIFVTITLLCYILVYVLAAVMFFRQIQRNDLQLSASQLIMPILLLPVSSQIMNMLIEHASLNPVQMLYYRIYSIMVCISVFTIMINTFKISKIKNEMYLIQMTNERQKEQYDMKKDLINLISIRAHDMKKQLRILQNPNLLYDTDSLNEIEQELSKYDSIADTGNKVLDVILTDVGLRCEKEGIRLTYLLDGKQLDFIDPIDIHAIFGNLFDNAIESVHKLKDPQKRIISLKMTSVGDMLYFHTFNYYDGELIFKDGLPQTTKEHAENHGLGMKSICMSIKKYNGELNISTQEHVFNANFMLCRKSARS